GTLRVVDWQIAPAQAAATQEDAVWQAVKRQVGTSITPLLKPGWVPSDLSGVQMLNAAPGTFEVEYRGQGKSLDISVSTLQPPDLGPNGSRTAVTVRFEQATLQQQSAAAGGKIWLWWDETGKWIPVEGAAPKPAVTYMILAAGLTPDEVQQVAGRMVPLE
ncbi:MAG: hypothetical protein ACM3JD_16510, partial [Rudaea sp.]